MKIFLFLALLAVVSSARADVSDSGNLSIGGSGVISGTVTVQGGAFSVGGSSFAISGGSATVAYQIVASSISLTGTGSTSYDLTLSSGMHFVGSKTGITWADGSTSTTSSSGSGIPLVLDSTYTYGIASNTQSQTTFLTCFPGSTVTFTMSGNYYVEAEFNGYVLNGSNDTFMWVLMDGNFMGKMTASATTCSGGTGGVASFITHCVVRNLTLPSAASHSFCFGIGGGSGNTTLYDSDGNITKAHNSFQVRETLSPGI